MIPKTINYCWFGGKELSPLAQKCIESWKKHCPEYEIIEWNEKNYLIDEKCQFVKDAYKQRKWAFVSDYARLEIIYNNGGIYLDTDVELLKDPSHLIEKGIGFMGFSDENIVADGLGFAAEEGNSIVKEMLEVYEHLTFTIEDMNKFTCPEINTMVLRKHGLKLDNSYQLIGNVQILPMEYLCPINLHSGIRYFTKNTVSVHHFSGSWMPASERLKMQIIYKIKKILPTTVVTVVRKLLGGNKSNES